LSGLARRWGIRLVKAILVADVVGLAILFLLQATGGFFAGIGNIFRLF
jgi:hypothetical protein